MMTRSWSSVMFVAEGVFEGFRWVLVVVVDFFFALCSVVDRDDVTSLFDMLWCCSSKAAIR